MTALTFVPVTDDATARAWQQVHNEIIHTDPLSLDQVKKRSQVRFLDVAYVGDQLVGCATVRPVEDDDPVTVIVRILPSFRRQGLGSQYLTHAMGVAHSLDAATVRTIVLASNVDGLEFAIHRGFVEAERHTPEGQTVPFVILARTLEGRTTH